MKLILIYNPTTKNGKIKRYLPHIEKRFRQRYSVVDLVASKDAKDMENIAMNATKDYDVICVAGGDGSIHIVANGILKSGNKAKLAILPFGTVNDVAKTLNIPTDIDGAIDVILKGYEIDYDMLKVNDEYITYSFAGGLFVTSSFKTNRAFKNVFGKLAYYASGFAEIFKKKSIPLTITVEEERYHGKYLLALCLNSHSVGGFKLKDMGSVSDGKMDIILIERGKCYIKALLTIAMLFLKGVSSVKDKKNVRVISCENAFIENHSNSTFAIDGEAYKFLQRNIKVDDSITIFYGK